MKKNISGLLIIALATTVFSKTASLEYKIFREQEMTEFAGVDSRAPLEFISAGSIRAYCEAVNSYFPMIHATERAYRVTDRLP